MFFSPQTAVGIDAEKRTLGRTRALALTGVIGPLWFATLVVVQGFLLPDYSHVRMPISALAAWPTGWIQNINFYVAGVLTMAFAVAVHRAVKPTPWGQAAFALLMMSGIGVVLAGVFPWTMVEGVPTKTPPHVVAAIMAFASAGIGFVTFSRRMKADPHWRHLATYTMWTGIAVLILFVMLGFFAVDEGAPLHSWAGLLQRGLCTVWFTCMIVLSYRVRTVCS